MQCKSVKSFPYLSHISKILPIKFLLKPIPNDIIKGNPLDATISTNLNSVDSKPAIFNLLTPKSTNSLTACSSNGVDINSIPISSQ